MIRMYFSFQKGVVGIQGYGYNPETSAESPTYPSESSQQTTPQTNSQKGTGMTLKHAQKLFKSQPMDFTHLIKTNFCSPSPLRESLQLPSTSPYSKGKILATSIISMPTYRISVTDVAFHSAVYFCYLDIHSAWESLFWEILPGGGQVFAVTTPRGGRKTTLKMHHFSLLVLNLLS